MTLQALYSENIRLRDEVCSLRDEVKRLLGANAWQAERIRQLEAEVESWKGYQNYVNQCVDECGVYKP